MATVDIELRNRRNRHSGSGSGSGSTETSQNSTDHGTTILTPTQSSGVCSERVPSNASARGMNRSQNQALRAELPVASLAEFGAQVTSYAGSAGVCFTGASLLGLLSCVPKYASIIALISGGIGVLLGRGVLMVITGLEKQEFNRRVRGVAYYSVLAAAVSFGAVIIAGCSWLITGPLANNEVDGSNGHLSAGAWLVGMILAIWALIAVPVHLGIIVWARR